MEAILLAARCQPAGLHNTVRVLEQVEKAKSELREQSLRQWRMQTQGCISFTVIHAAQDAIRLTANAYGLFGMSTKRNHASIIIGGVTVIHQLFEELAE